MPTENGLPQYVSRHSTTNDYRYYRRPPKGVAGSAFVRSFGTKDRRVMLAKYSAVHTEAEYYIDRLITGRAISDQDLFAMMATAGNIDTLFKSSGSLNTPADWTAFIAVHGTDQMKALTTPDRDRLIVMLRALYAGTETAQIKIAQHQVEERRERFAQQFGTDAVPVPASALTLRMAFDQAWMPAKNRSPNSVTEVGRYVDEFEALNGVRDIGQYDRTHWAKWRADCLERHGPGATAFKRFSMMKTVCNEAIRAGLFERKNFHGQDVAMAKIKAKKLRNEGWHPDELKKWFGQPVFKGDKSGPHADADYWASVIIAYTGAAIIEVSHMNTDEIVQRHGFWTMRLWRDKSHNSDRIIPIPKQVLDLGFLDYVRSRPKHSPLFVTKSGERVSNKNLSQQFSRLRQKAGITRQGADAHAYRHHIKTLLPDVGCPDRVSDYITGHAPPNVGRTYGKVEFSTAREYLDQIDLGVMIPKWQAR